MVQIRSRLDSNQVLLLVREAEIVPMVTTKTILTPVKESAA